MPKYITYFSYTREAAQALIDKPSDRSAAASALVESVGHRTNGSRYAPGVVSTATKGTRVGAFRSGTGCISGMGVVFAALAALVYGVADYCGGRSSRSADSTAVSSRRTATVTGSATGNPSSSAATR